MIVLLPTLGFGEMFVLSALGLVLYGHELPAAADRLAHRLRALWPSGPG